ncbi:NAD(P)-dependent dehydrogenase (short-subunit alcohol dehydrogenase family) [Agromyces cerinus]|uniref:SDR family oxidoreductase n=1 Tax=Agromyces cerinus TaxID=33878 RepID=UPI00195E54F9|nr:SDR family oxidoreductase [Agromyces cerinus]MBM7832817.1 NAD(P)-dependent dehydrogenase (short-subunit alcohol dehydrogenase family) [Agromyces cerinus]
MTGRFANDTVLVIGGTHRLGAAIAAAADAEDARVTVSSHAPRDESTLHIDLRDEASVAAAAQRIGPIDHLISTASMTYSAPIREMELSRVQEAMAAKITGPLLLAKHFQIRQSLTLFSGQVAWRPGSGSYATGITNGAIAFAAQHLAAELAPVRVNAISPGIIDSGLWDARGAEKAAFLTAAASRTLVGGTGTVQDIVDAVLWIMSAPFFTGETLRLDGGRR